MKLARLGTVIHGTGRPEDIIPALASKLRELMVRNEAEPDVDRTPILKLLDEANCPFEAAFYDTDAANELIDELTDALNEFAPPFCYFGAHEGDGSDFGFWFSNDAFDSAVSNGEILKVGDLSELDIRRDMSEYEYIAVVNDHGNVSLHTFEVKIETTEVWSVV